MLLSASNADVLLFVPLKLPLFIFPHIFDEYKVLLLLVPPKYLFMLVYYNVFLYFVLPVLSIFYIEVDNFP
jgi:hypothetical protein